MYVAEKHCNGSAMGSPRIPTHCAPLCLVAMTSTQSAEGVRCRRRPANDSLLTACTCTYICMYVRVACSMYMCMCSPRPTKHGVMRSRGSGGAAEAAAAAEWLARPTKNVACAFSNQRWPGSTVTRSLIRPPSCSPATLCSAVPSLASPTPLLLRPRLCRSPRFPKYSL